MRRTNGGVWGLRGTLAAAVAGMLACASASAELDDNVQWAGVSHDTNHDLRPRVPIANESFEVRFQTFAGDITSSRVRVSDGASQSLADAAVISTRGPYVTWAATVPITANSVVQYAIELTDGSDTDYLGSAGMVDDLSSVTPFFIDFTTLSHAPLGATTVPSGVVFRVWSPDTTTCHVRGQFNGWSLDNPMTRVGEDYIAYVPGATVGQMYKFYFDDSIWNSDPRAAELVPTDGYNARVVSQDSYGWFSPPFSPRPIEELVFYQLHVPTFAGRNDPVGATPFPSSYFEVSGRMSHLSDMGINAVMLNPIHEYPGAVSGGYNSVNAYSFESSLGGTNELKRMVDSMHNRGIAVVLDVVWNHVSISDNYLLDSFFDGTNPYFDDPLVDTPWGAQADFDRQGVFDYYLDSVETMLTEYRLDGFRVDATMYLTDSAFTPHWGPGQDFVRAMHNRMANRHIDKHTIAEIYIDSGFVTDDQNSGGLGFTAQYHNEFKEAVRSAVFDASFGSPNLQRVANVLDGQGFGVSGSSVFNYFELHDDAWDLNGEERAVSQIDTTVPHDDDFARSRTLLGNSLALLSRGVPAILQGTEWLEDEGWELNRIDWSHKVTYSGIYQFYSDLIGLRTSEPALYANSPLNTYHLNEALDVMAFERWRDDDSFVAIINFSDDTRAGYRVGMPRDEHWEVVINSNDPIYQGLGGGPAAGPVNIEPVANGPFGQSVVLDLPPRSLILLRHAPPACAADLADASGFGPPDGQVDFGDFFALSFLAGPCGSGTPNPGCAGDLADTSGFGPPDGQIDFGDFFAMSFQAGPCP